jgi:hypothetical protein
MPEAPTDDFVGVEPDPAGEPDTPVLHDTTNSTATEAAAT